MSTSRLPAHPPKIAQHARRHHRPPVGHPPLLPGRYCYPHCHCETAADRITTMQTLRISSVRAGATAPPHAAALRSARALTVSAIHHQDASNGQQPRRQRQHAPLAAAARLCGAAAAAAVLLAGGPALARETVAEFATSGLIFRDTVKIVELDDDKGGWVGGRLAGWPTGVCRVGRGSRVASPLHCRPSHSVHVLLPPPFHEQFKASRSTSQTTSAASPSDLPRSEGRRAGGGREPCCPAAAMPPAPARPPALLLCRCF